MLSLIPKPIMAIPARANDTQRVFTYPFFIPLEGVSTQAKIFILFLTITKKSATITPNDASKTYGASDPELTATVTGTVGTDTLDYTLVRQEGETVGTYTISVTLGTNDNYEVSTGTATFTIPSASSACVM